LLSDGEDDPAIRGTQLATFKRCHSPIMGMSQSDGDVVETAFDLDLE
jgi:hypothetical protein